MMNLSKRNTVRLFSFIAGAFLVLTGIIFAQRQYGFETRRLTHTAYLRQTGELAQNIEKIAENLEIQTISTSKDTRTYAAFDIWQLCSKSVENLTDLPLSEYNTEKLLYYLNQVGQYVRYLATQDELKRDDIENLLALQNYSLSLSNQIYEIEQNILNGKSGYSDVKVPQLEKTAFVGFNFDYDDAAMALAGITDNASEYPTLVYDGKWGQGDEATVGAEVFDIEAITKKLPESVHILSWNIVEEDGVQCIEIEVETAAQNVYGMFFSVDGKELKVVRK